MPVSSPNEDHFINALSFPFIPYTKPTMLHNDMPIGKAKKPNVRRQISMITPIAVKTFRLIV